MATAYLSLGSNLGDKRKYLATAIDLLAKKCGNVYCQSGFYETKPWGFESPNFFLNAAVRLETALDPMALLAVTKQIEHKLGRTHKTTGIAYQDRIIDIDLLLYDDIILHTKELILPHPRMCQRLFVMQPLAEIAPLLRHPLLNCNMAELATRLR